MAGSVLIVDDDQVFRGLARRMVVAAGLAVVAEASTVAEALAAAGRTRPDAALVDVGLPDGDGVALARELSALPWRPRGRRRHAASAPAYGNAASVPTDETQPPRPHSPYGVTQRDGERLCSAY